LRPNLRFLPPPPPFKFRGGVGEIFQSVFRARPRIEPFIYTFDGARHRSAVCMGDYSVDDTNSGNVRAPKTAECTTIFLKTVIQAILLNASQVCMWV